MVGSRTLTALVGLALSLLVSVVAWVYFDSLLVFLVVPFIPFLLWGRRGDRRPSETFRCPACDFRTTDQAFAYCPRDGTELRRE